MTKTKIEINPDYRSLEEWVKRLPGLFVKEGDQLFHKRNTVKAITAPNGKRLVVKRYHRTNLAQKLTYGIFKPSKARRAYDYAFEFQAAGIDTPTSVAVIEVYRYGLLVDSYYVSEFTDYGSLFPLLKKQKDYSGAVAHGLSRFLAEMHQKGILHGDPNLNNVLYKDGRYCVIDINRSKIGVDVTRRVAMRNLARLTHRKSLLIDVVGEYARCRGWDVAEAQRDVVCELTRFERRTRLKRKIKKYLTIWKKH